MFGAFCIHCGHSFISSEGLSIKGSGENREYDDQVYERLTERVTPDSIVDEYLEKCKLTVK